MKTDYQIDIISRVKRLREQQGVSQARMASILGISTGQMGNIESYDKPHKYTLKQMVTICKALGTSVEDIFFTPGQEHGMSLDAFIECLIKYQEK